ncbi:response regulator transcription factor [Uliginosibacterium gangwonense]|uniref:response regulator transcription factor n=1 Tax=Uliginosibacterium gangwonense TaxID=392736 RepID=UPI000372BF58|nr:response regulator transcription factor [Uliginosibacterium gangwonense]
MRVLLVEDDPALANTISRALQGQADAQVDWTARGEPVLNSLSADPYDLLVLDIGLPGIDGFEVLRRLRAAGQRLPVLVLTGREAIDDRVHGLELGADDYMVKPFALPEMVARAKALVRRGRGMVDKQIRVAKVVMDMAAHRAWVADKEMDLPSREWQLLEYLLAHVGKVVSKDHLVSSLSGWEGDVSENAVEVYISRLRTKLAESGLRIRTVRGFGYLLEELADAAGT